LAAPLVAAQTGRCFLKRCRVIRMPEKLLQQTTKNRMPNANRITAKLGALSGWIGVIAMLLMIVVAGARTPGYSHVSQFISELGARGAPNEWGVRLAGFLPSGLFLLAFCGCAFVVLPRTRATALGLLGLAIYAAGYVVAAAFPCDLGCQPEEPSASQLIHNVGGLIGYFLAPGFLLVLALAARSWPDAGRLVVAGYAASGAALVALLSLSPSSPVVGLSQRLMEFAVLAWVLLCCGYLTKQGTDRPAGNRPASG
jgi:hypothetical membrane protein